MISIDQGKRSDTLGKPMRHVTPCKGKSPHNMLCFNAFALSWRKLHGTLYPGPSCLGKRQSRAAAVLRASAPSGAFRLDDASFVQQEEEPSSWAVSNGQDDGK